MRRNEDRFPARREQQSGLTPWEESFFTPTSLMGGGSPWQMMRRMQEDMDRLFGAFYGGQGGGGQQGGLAQMGQQMWAPSVDISQTDGEWTVEADLPGVKRDDIEVHVENNVLTIRARMREEREERPERGEGQGGGQRQYHHRERRSGFFERSMRLPETVDDERIACEFRDGVLTVHIPKPDESRRRPRRVPIGEGAGQAAGSGQAAMTSGQTGGDGRGRQEAPGSDRETGPVTAGGRIRTEAEQQAARGGEHAEEEEEETAGAGRKGGRSTSRTRKKTEG